ncbi:hypothetical protein [Bradyrhizobium sp.]|jgi:hypothetical protein|uniref:hypothetical protein n=1 Tax=Bradyrhizobium sp. TaxID=376 RepID=UPI003BAF0B73
MRISTLDISRITTTVRRHEALLRYARYLFIFNLVIFLWEVAIPQLSYMTPFRGSLELLASPAWKWSVLVLGSVGATYLVLAHRLWWAYAIIFLAQVGYFFMPSPDKEVLRFSVLLAIGVITLPPMRPLGPLATELAIMIIGFSYIMIVYCLYSATWTVNGGRVPRGAYGRRLSPLEPLRPSRLLDTLLPGHRSQNVTASEAALFALSSVLFVAASMAPFYGFRRVQNASITFSSQVQHACMREGFPAQPAEVTIACLAQFRPWSQVVIDIGAPLVISAVCLVLANRLRYFGRQHFLHRLDEQQISPFRSTLFLRAFRDDQMRVRQASRNLFSIVFDLGRVPATLDELMLERLDGPGDLIAIGNPQDRKGAAQRTPWGAQRLYVDDAHWRETVTVLARDAERIVLCVDASDGVRWEIAHVLRNGHANKTLFFLNPSIDVQTRTRLLVEDFGVSVTDFASFNVDHLLALRATSSEQLILMFCAKPERDAYLVAARLAFEDTVVLKFEMSPNKDQNPIDQDRVLTNKECLAEASPHKL